MNTARPVSETADASLVGGMNLLAKRGERRKPWWHHVPSVDGSLRGGGIRAALDDVLVIEQRTRVVRIRLRNHHGERRALQRVDHVGEALRECRCHAFEWFVEKQQ